MILRFGGDQMEMTIKKLALALVFFASSQSWSLAEAPKGLDGEWVQISGMAGDHDVSNGNFRLSIDGDRYVLKNLPPTVDFRISVDTRHSPPRLDRTFETGEALGKTESGIFEFDGPRLLTSFSSPGGERPSSLDSEKILSGDVWTWEREGNPPAKGLSLSRKIEGRWHLVSVKIRDKVRPDELIKNCYMSISEGKMRAENKVELKGRVTKHADPNQIDFKWSTDPIYDTLGIYEFLDKDTLRICTQPSLIGRPTNFEVDVKKARTLLVYKRSTK